MALAFQALDALDDFLLRHVDRLSDEGERCGDQRNLTLQGTQQLTVPLIDFLHLDPRLRCGVGMLGIRRLYEIGRRFTSIQMAESATGLQKSSEIRWHQAAPRSHRAPEARPPRRGALWQPPRRRCDRCRTSVAETAPVSAEQRRKAAARPGTCRA